eukprot:gene2280-4437_t
MSINKIDFSCPVVSTLVLEVHNEMRVVSAIGPLVLVYDIATGSILCRVHVFDSHSVQGIQCYPTSNNIIAYGDKSVKVLSYDNNDAITIIQSLGPLDDLVLNCQLLSLSSQHNNTDNDIKILLIGYAHNFIDIFSITTNEHLQRLTSIPCVLFSLSFSSIDLNSNSLYIACGTTFGKIIINTIQFTPHNTQSLLEHVHTFNGHEGVIFRIKWNRNNTKLASVSDDRSIRLWNLITKEQILICWGHICRVWDVIFMNENSINDNELLTNKNNIGNKLNDIILASCGEDSCVKLWNGRGECVTSLRGHQGRNIWSIATTVSYDIIVSGGNDSSIKIWPLKIFQHMLPLETSTTAQEHDGSSDSSSSNGSVMVSMIVVVLLDGAIWIVDVDVDGREGSMNWKECGRVDLSITTADISFGSSQIICFFAHHDKSVSFHVFQLTSCMVDTETETEATSIGTEPVSLSACLSEPTAVCRHSKRRWMPHDVRTINLWIVRTPTESSSGYGVTATVKGRCCLWSLSLQPMLDNDENENENENDSTSIMSSSAPLAMFCCQKENIASMCLWIQSVEEEPFAALLVVGDSKGGLSVFRFDSQSLLCRSSDITPTTATTPASELKPSTLPCVWSYSRAHGIDPVSSLTAYGERGFISLGHDGNICIYDMTASGEAKLLSKMTSHPISTPEQILVTGHGNGNAMTMLIAGFEGNMFQVWDLRSNVLLMSVEGGSWKRNHHSRMFWKTTTKNNNGNNGKSVNNTDVIGFPSLSFVCAASCTNGTENQRSNGTELRLHTSNHFLREDSCAVPSRLHLGVAGHGKVSYSVAMFNIRGNNGAIDTQSQSQSQCLYAVGGGEEGQVRCFSLPHFALQQFSYMPSSVAVRAITVSQRERRSRGLVVAAGGRLSFAVWTFDGEYLQNKNQNNDDPDDHHQVMQQSSTSDVQMSNMGLGQHLYLHDLYNGSTWRQATQDHRILCAHCLPLNPHDDFNDNGSDDYHLLLLGDSRGKAVLSVINPSNHSSTSDPRAAVRITQEFVASESPLLCCQLLHIQSSSISVPETKDGIDKYRKVSCGCQYVLGVMGDTAGGVSVWLVAETNPNHIPSKGNDSARMSTKSLHLTSYLAHTMGCNAVSVTYGDADESTSSSMHRRGNNISGDIRLRRRTSVVIVTICTGGDDQAITVCRGESQSQSQYLITTHDEHSDKKDETLYVISVEGSCGSAIKGVYLHQTLDRLWLLSVGYDARLSLWTVNDPTDKLQTEEACSRSHNHSAVNSDDKEEEEGNNYGRCLAHSCDSNNVLTWCNGAVCNVGDVSGISASFRSSESDLVVVITGEGMQSFSVALPKEL